MRMRKRRSLTETRSHLSQWAGRGSYLRSSTKAVIRSGRPLGISWEITNSTSRYKVRLPLQSLLHTSPHLTTSPEQLVGRIRSAVGHHKQLARQLGAIDYEKGRVMLSINFPYGPPQMYEISGLLLTDNYIVWAAKTMPQIDYLRHRNAIFPTTAFWSVYASSKYLFNSQWQRAKDTLGWKDSVKKQSPFGGGSADQQSPWKGASNQQAPKIGPLPPVQPDASKRSGSEPSPHGAEVKSRPSSPPKMPPKIPLDNAALPVGQKAQRPDTFMIFMNTFMKNYAKTTSFLDPPRGSVVVSGLVEVRGAKGEATIDVVAAYDLKQSQYVIVSMTLRKLQPWEQRPKGGP